MKPFFRIAARTCVNSLASHRRFVMVRSIAKMAVFKARCLVDPANTNHQHSAAAVAKEARRRKLSCLFFSKFLTSILSSRPGFQASSTRPGDSLKDYDSLQLSIVHFARRLKQIGSCLFRSCLFLKLKSPPATCC